MNVDALKRDFKNLLTKGLPEPFDFNGITYIGTRTALKQADRYTTYGYTEKYSFSLITSGPELLTQPKKGDKITVAGTDYRVAGTEVSPGGIALRVDLETMYR